MNNEELILQFESDVIPADGFHHADHVRLAFAYPSQYPPLQALDKFSTALKRYAAARGKSQLYHEILRRPGNYSLSEMEREARMHQLHPGCRATPRASARTNQPQDRNKHVSPGQDQQ
jgi:hypothetical protein